MTQKQKEKWEIKFDKLWSDFQNDWCCSYPHERKRLNRFVRSQRQEAIGEAVEEIMEEVAELRFEEWKEPIDRVYKILKQKYLNKK